jgi:hypothetical protein
MYLNFSCCKRDWLETTHIQIFLQPHPSIQNLLVKIGSPYCEMITLRCSVLAMDGWRGGGGDIGMPCSDPGYCLNMTDIDTQV